MRHDQTDAAAGAPGGAALPIEDWDAFYQSFFDDVYRWLARMGAPEHDLEDLAQEVFLAAFRKLPGFRGEASVRTWLFAICRRVAWRGRRKHRFRRAALALLGRGEPARDASGPADARRDAERLLGGLSPDQRAVLLLHEVDGMSGGEIARLLGCPEATVWSRLRLARERLRRAAAGLGEEP